MQSNISTNPVDVGKSPKRYNRNMGPNVTINNIVTLDPEKYSRSPSTSKLSEDSNYDRVKFLVEERARYWRDLKVLYNDYTLVKMKQRELLDSEDNYVNKHCIEETIKLSNALKLKIQAKCKDIIFITNLCGNSEVNRVVQSLADGEDIDGVLIKKQKSAYKMRKAEAEKKKSKLSTKKYKVKVVEKSEVKHVDEVEEKSAPRRRSAVNEPKFFDSEQHWCQYCNVFPPTIKKYLQHLHDDSHKKKIKELKINESPWHKCLPEEQAWRTDSTDSVCVKAFNFFVPANGWFCQLCRSWMGDIHCAATHLRSYVHNMNLKNFQEKFPKWKQGWLDERTKALEKTFEGRKESADTVRQQQNIETRTISLKKKEENELESSSDEEEEPISRHRTSKSEMWVPNQKAFERVRNETNPIPTSTESSLVKFKVTTKKDRPPFIGKMPLINRSKKIVVKELPQNTTEKIATSCAESDKLQKQQNELTEIIIRRNEEENELKLKEFMKMAKKIKKGKKKMIDHAMVAECYNATEFVPVVEPIDPIDNLMGPPALVAQWEAEANYEYHMRQLHHYNMASQMMQMPQPQTFLLDPYHAIALHNQQYYNSSHMISNQYENFEIISRDDEQAYSQYIEFQNSPSSSPVTKMFASSKADCHKDVQTTAEMSDGKKVKSNSRPLGACDSPDELYVRRSSTQDDTRSSKSKRPSQIKVKSPKKPKTFHVIQKPPCLNTPSSSDLMPSFKETFLSADNSSGYIASLLCSNEEVKIVCANEPYRRRTAPSKRKRNRRKKELENQNNQGENLEKDDELVNNDRDNREMISKDIAKDRARNFIETNMSPTKSSTPKKSQTFSLKDKINSIRKKIDRNQEPMREREESIKRPRIVKNDDESIDEDRRPISRSNTVWNRHETYAESEDSEDEGDVDKLIYYDMTSI